MSTNKVSAKVLHFVLLAVFFSLLVSFLRRIIIYRQITFRFKQKEAEVKSLEEKRRALTARLAEVSDFQFLNEETRKLLGVGSTGMIAREKNAVEVYEAPDLLINPATESNYQKWLRFFGF